MILEPFEMPHFKNPYGLLGLLLIIVLSFLISAWFDQKRNAIRKKSRRTHTAITLASTYFDIQSFLYGGGAILGFMVLLAMSKK